MVASNEATIAARCVELLRSSTTLSAEIAHCTLTQAVERVVPYAPALIVLVMSPNPREALAALREIREITAPAVIVVGPVADSKLILKSLSNGASQYIDESEVTRELIPSLRRLDSVGRSQIAAGRVVGVLAASGGSGASTVATNVAVSLALHHGQVGLIDMKLSAGDLATLLDVDPVYSIADYCRNLDRMDQTMFEQCFAKHRCGVRMLASPESFAQIEEVTARGVRKLLAMSRGTFPYTIVDVAHPFLDAPAQVLCQADAILLVMQLAFTSLRQTRRVVDHLISLGIDQQRIHLVANRCRRPQELRVGEVEDALGMKLHFQIPDDPRSVNWACNRGVPVVLDRPRSKVSRIISEIATSMNGARKN